MSEIDEERVVTPMGFVGTIYDGTDPHAARGLGAPIERCACDARCTCDEEDE